MASVFKEKAHQLVDSLPETADWADLAERVESILDIEAGLTDGAANRISENAVCGKSTTSLRKISHSMLNAWLIYSPPASRS